MFNSISFLLSIMRAQFVTQFKALALIAGLIILLAAQSHAGLLFNYTELMSKDEAAMIKLVEDKLNESKKSYAGKSVPLKEALQAIYSRPNSDQVIAKVIGPVASALQNEKSYEKSVKELVTEALNALKNTRAFSAKVQVTYVIFLTNLINDYKTQFETNSFYKDTVKRIADAKIKLTAAAESEISKTLKINPQSPSDIIID